MNADSTEELIAKAIAALPYRGPSAGFKARVMAGVEAAALETRDWRPALLKATGALTVSWAALLLALGAGPAFRFLAEAAPLLAEPGGLGLALDLLAARGALLLVKASGFFSLASDLGAAVLAALPPFYEIALASLACAAVIKAVPGGRAAARRV